jgi:hypothetical protein
VRVIQRLTAGYYTKEVVKSDPNETDPFAGGPVRNAGQLLSYNVTLQGTALAALPPGGGQVYLTPSQISDQVATAWGGPYPVNANGVVGPIPATDTNLKPAPAPLPAIPWGGKVTLTYVTGALPAGSIGAEIAKKNGFLEELEEIEKAYASGTSGVSGLQRAFKQYEGLRAVQPPSSLDFASLNGVIEELNVQRSLESRWQDLVRTVAPEAGDRESVFRLLRLVIAQASFDAEQLAGQGVSRLPRVPTALPPQFEQSLEVLLPGRRLPPP